MTVYEFMRMLFDMVEESNYTMFVNSPDGKQDYFISGVVVDEEKKQVFITTDE